MALVDLISDLSKFRSTVKSSGEMKPETSKAKSLRGFASFQPISEKLSIISPKLDIPKKINFEQKLNTTSLDDIVKKLKKDLIINSVSKYSPVNASKNQNTLNRVSMESIISKFSSIRQDRISSRLDKSNIVILKTDSGTNNNESPIDVNMIIAKMVDKSSSSPSINKIVQSDNKANSSPAIKSNKNDQSDNITDPEVVVNKILLSDDKEKQSPSLSSVLGTDDKTDSSPNVNLANNSSDKAEQTPNVIVNAGNDDKILQSPNVENSSEVLDKSNQSVNVQSSTQFSDRSEESPPVFSDINTPDKSKTSPNVFYKQLDDQKIKSSPDVKDENEEYNNITDPKTPVFAKPLSIDRRGQSVSINKNLISPINNIIDPNIGLEKSVLTFDRKLESPEIFKDLPKQGLVENPEIAVSKIEQGTNHLEDGSNLNLDGIPFKFVVESRLAKKQPNQLVDDKNRYSGQSNQIDDNSQLNLDNVLVTNPRGRNENPDKSILSVKGTQAVNFFPDTNSSGFTTRVQKGVTNYNNNSEFTWNGNSQSAPTTNFITDINATGFTKFSVGGNSEYKNETSKYGFSGNPSVNFLTDANATGFTNFATLGNTEYKNQTSKYGFSGKPAVNFFSNTNATGFTLSAQSLDSYYINDSSKLGWPGNRQQAPEVDYFDLNKKNTSGGFNKFISSLESKFIRDSSNFAWSGGRTSAPSINYFTDTNQSGFNTFATKLESKYVNETSEFTFKGGMPSPINFLTDTNATGFTNKAVSLQTEYIKDSSKFGFIGSSKQAPVVNFIKDDVNTGFTSFAEHLRTEFKIDKSRFGWSGNRQQAQNVNNFLDQSSSGFTKLPISLRSELKPDTSRFTWVGNRQQAPEVDFLGIPGQNPKAISGFTKFFIDKTQNKLSDKYSLLSFAGTTIRSTIKPVPYTSFFGFIPSERAGFAVQMNNVNDSMYPILEPRLKFNDDAATRFGIQKIRGQKAGSKTTDDISKYVPVSLGGLFWSDGTNTGIATLGRQVPHIKIEKGAVYPGSAYFRKYERFAKETTDRLGYLTKWATKRNSPSPLDDQYNKYKLQKESVNREPAFFFQPYIVRGIQRDGEVENQRWGFGVTFDDGLVRGGVVTQVERLLADTLRLGKWTLSVKGLMFNVKQIGLQLMNPNVDINPAKSESSILGISATQAFNPLSILANIPSARVGLHLPRHGRVPYSKDYLNRYEDATLARENNSKFISPEYKSFERLKTPSIGSVEDRQTDYNRLIGLMKELLPTSFKPIAASDVSADPTTAAAAKVAIELAKKLTGQTGIARLSSNFGGAQSMLGVGGTQINRATHPYLTTYTTTPLLMLTGELKEPQYPSSAKKDTFYSATTMYKDLFGDVLRTIAINLQKGPSELNKQNQPNKSNIKNIQKSTIDRIAAQNPFDGKCDPFDSRLKAVDSTLIKTGENISDGLRFEHGDRINNPLKQYRALTYDKLGLSKDRRRSRNGSTNVGDLNDFREDLTSGDTLKFSTDPAVSDYANQNLQDRFGFGKHGKVGSARNKPFQNTVTYAKAGQGYAIPVQKQNSEFRGDRINIIDYKKSRFDISRDLVYEKGKFKNSNIAGTDDLIEFYFTGLTIAGASNNKPAEIIVFRATFGNIRDSHSADWTPIKYMGRGDPLYVYQGYDREISFDFVVQITSRDEMKASWRKLNYLASWTAPEYNKGGHIRGPIIRLNIGNLYRKMPGFISNISYDFDNTESTWETAQLKQDQDLVGATAEQSSPGVLQLPKTIKVNCSFTPIGVYRPEYNGTMYSLFDDTTGGNLENGLIPNNDVKVNYFKTFDLDENGKKAAFDSKDNTDYYAIKPGDEANIPTIDTTKRESMTGETTPQNTNSVGVTNLGTRSPTDGNSTPLQSDTSTFRNDSTQPQGGGSSIFNPTF